ncbi:hypothetical protein KEM55_004111, partial [Ascosphaera atra]
PVPGRSLAVPAGSPTSSAGSCFVFSSPSSSPASSTEDRSQSVAPAAAAPSRPTGPSPRPPSSSANFEVRPPPVSRPSSTRPTANPTSASPDPADLLQTQVQAKGQSLLDSVNRRLNGASLIAATFDSLRARSELSSDPALLALLDRIRSEICFFSAERFLDLASID